MSSEPHPAVRTLPSSPAAIADSWGWDETRLKQWQLDRFNAQLREILPANEFYRRKFDGESLQLQSLDQLSDLPLTEKSELVKSAQESPGELSAHHTYARSAYSRLHRTSGTTGSPLMILDTAADWQWWSDTWQHVLQAAHVTPEDRVFLAFSFGPFIGFWSAHQACVDRGATVIPGGGLSSLARLEFLRQSAATVVLCTPSYALHLGEVAKAEKVDLQSLAVDRIIVAGEAGGSVPAVRAKIESLWNARVVDHSGATEIGPWGFGWPQRPGLHLIETSFIAELLPLATEPGNSQNNLHELLITSLGRWGTPVIRYRTGDVVRPT